MKPARHPLQDISVRLRALVIGILVPGVLALGALMFLQSSFIYFPRDYSDSAYRPLLERVRRVEYHSGGSRQSAFLLGEKAGHVPAKVCWLFGGNGALALDWLWVLEEPERDGVVCVLADYPGYGFNGGRPSPANIQNAIDDLTACLSERFNLSVAELGQRSCVIGHSLGSAVALDTAVRLEAPRVIAISPFTSMRDMAKLAVGPWLAHFLTHHYENETSIATLGSRRDCRVELYHGQHDEMIPMWMPRRLKELGGGGVELFEIAGAGHNDILDRLGRYLNETIAEPLPIGATPRGK